MYKEQQVMHACRAAGGLVMLQSEDMQSSRGGLGLKSQIGVNCKSCECQFKETSTNAKSPMALLNRRMNKAMIIDMKNRKSSRQMRLGHSLTVTLILCSAETTILRDLGQEEP